MAKKTTKKRGNYSGVYKGFHGATTGGLKKSDILRLKKKGNVRYVSKKRHNRGVKNPWIKALMKARRELGLQHEFVAPRKSGGTKEQRDLYRTAMEYYEN